MSVLVVVNCGGMMMRDCACGVNVGVFPAYFHMLTALNLMNDEISFGIFYESPKTSLHWFYVWFSSYFGRKHYLVDVPSLCLYLCSCAHVL